MCLPDVLVCDGLKDCPEWDDEELCFSPCPSQCQCFGLAYYCHQPVTDTIIKEQLRFLDASHSGTQLINVWQSLVMVIWLELDHCDIVDVSSLNCSTKYNIQHLDLSFNRILQIGKASHNSM